MIDVRLDSNGDLPLGYASPFVSGSDLVAQRIRVRLRTFRGEPVDAVTEGLPFPEWSSARPADLDAIGARVQAEILAVPGVSRLADFSATLDRETRSILVSFTAETTFDDEPISSSEVLRSANASPFAAAIAR